MLLLKQIKSPKKERGFTLIEIMVVVIIIGILAAIVVPNITDQVDESRVTAANSEIQRIASSLQAYKIDNFKYPSTDQGLQALRTKPTGEPEPKNYDPAGYLNKEPIDPWGEPYQYFNPGTDGKPFDLYSFGADGKEGGEGADEDIHYWK